MSADRKPRPELLALAESCGAVLTGKPDGSEAIAVVFTIPAWQAFDAALAAPAAPEPHIDGWPLYSGLPPAAPATRPRHREQAMSAEPVAWIDKSGHPHHLRYVQGARERELYGALQPLYDRATLDAAVAAARAEERAAERERCLALLFQGGAPRSADVGGWAPVSEAIEKGLAPAAIRNLKPEGE